MAAQAQDLKPQLKEEVDFLVEDCHFNAIALEAMKTEEMSTEWVRIMRALLTKCDDASIKSGIEKKLKNDDVYGAVFTTLVKWTAYASGQAMFSDLLETIGRTNPTLQKRLSDARYIIERAGGTR